jgi:hypothetical protein
LAAHALGADLRARVDVSGHEGVGSALTAIRSRTFPTRLCRFHPT